MRLTLKRRKRVLIPMHAELSFALEAESQRRSPLPEDLVQPTIQNVSSKDAKIQ